MRGRLDLALRRLLLLMLSLPLHVLCLIELLGILGFVAYDIRLVRSEGPSSPEFLQSL